MSINSKTVGEFIGKQIAYLLVFGIDMGLAWIWQWSFSTTFWNAAILIVIWNQCRDLIDRTNK